MNENVDAAGHDKKSGRTEIAFFAHDLALLIAMQNGRAFRPIVELRARHFFERRQILDELIDAQWFTSKFLDDFLHVGPGSGNSARNTCSLLFMEEYFPLRNSSAPFRQVFGLFSHRDFLYLLERAPKRFLLAFSD